MTVSDLLEQLVTGLIMPLSLLQVVNNLFQTADQEQAVRRQLVNNLCVFTRVPKPSTKDKK